MKTVKCKKTIKYATNPPQPDVLVFVEGENIEIPKDDYEKFLNLGYIDADTEDDNNDNTWGAGNDSNLDYVDMVKSLTKDMKTREAKNQLEKVVLAEFGIDLDKRVTIEQLISDVAMLYQDKFNA